MPTVQLSVTLPQDSPFLSVATKPVPGWTVATAEASLPTPVQMEGTTITKAARTVTWAASPGGQVGPEPEHPAPGFTITPATSGESGAQPATADAPARWLAGGALAAAVLDQTPTQVVLRFDQPALDGGEPAGRYTVQWRVTSVDGHQVSGTFGFTSTAAGLGHPAAAPLTLPPVNRSAQASGRRVGLTLAVVGGIVALLGALLWPQAARRSRWRTV